MSSVTGSVMSHLNDEFSNGLSDDFQQLRGFLSALDVEVAHGELGQGTYQPCCHLQGQQNQNRQPVKAVVYGGPCKSPLKHKNTNKPIWYSNLNV